jgi:hypothetical protein
MPGLSEKMRPNVYLPTWQVTAIVLAGTAVRLWYGFFTKAWLGSPDQLAWGLDIDAMLHNKNWSYTQLTHAPHEGAAFFISLFSLVLRPLQSFLPSLSLAALLIDTVGRLIQIRITQTIWGAETARWFAVWSILAVPLLIPWGTVNFGLHALLSFVPFVFCWIVFKYRRSAWLPAICGVTCGIAVSLSYNSIVLIAAGILFFLFDGEHPKRRMQKLFLFFAVLLVTLLPHLFARICYGSVSEAALSIRGVPLKLTGWRQLGNLCSVWFTSLPGSFLLLPGGVLCATVFLFLLTGMVLYARAAQTKASYLPVAILVIFIAAYACSPFYGKEYGNTNYVYYRHLCYIVPLLAVLSIHGFVTAGFWKKMVLAVWLLLCGGATIYYISAATKASPAYRAAGWILAKKYQDRTDLLFSIPAITPDEYRQELVKGFGWGLGAALLQENNPASVEKMIVLISHTPPASRELLSEGVRYAFAKGVTPVLDPVLLAQIELRLALINEKKQ